MDSKNVEMKANIETDVNEKTQTIAIGISVINEISDQLAKSTNDDEVPSNTLLPLTSYMATVFKGRLVIFNLLNKSVYGEFTEFPTESFTLSNDEKTEIIHINVSIIDDTSDDEDEE